MDISWIFLIIVLVVGAVIGFLYARFHQFKKQQNFDPYSLPEMKHANSEIEELKGSLANTRTEKENYLRSLATTEQRNKELEDRLSKQGEELQKVRLEMQTEFKLSANKIFEEKSDNFKKQNIESLKVLLDPFHKRIREFEQTVQDTFTKSTVERGLLMKQLSNLKELNQTMSQEARHLTEALKGDNKTQGNWGEVILERILESSGLKKGHEYKVQHSTTSSNGRRIQPDIIVNLPEGKHLIIDSKVSLVHYEAYSSTDNEEERQVFLKKHLHSLRTHIKDLNEKQYATGADLDSPDFVLMFLPIESSFGLAVQADKQLFDFAWMRKIVIVTPSTLLATMRTIANIWKHEHQNQNAIKIADEAGKLYDKFVGLVGDLDKLGSQMKTAQGTWDDAMNKLSTGRGNLISKMDKLKSMGINAQKDLEEKNKNRLEEAKNEDRQE